ncbi:MAG: hypothetical protein IT307_00020 [Chloroflexi bacterium]|nr:hypothetical protein [Chloroflexota bacterium]
MAGQSDTPGWTRSDERELHARLLAGDPVATVDLAERFLPPLVRQLQRRFPRLEPNVVETIAIDSVLRLGSQPQRYLPDRARLLAFLRLDAQGDVLNALKSEKRRQERLTSLEAVELRSAAGNSFVDKLAGPESLLAEDGEEQVARLCEGLEARDREVVELMVEGERRTAVFARALGLEALDAIAQAREVKRAKDRLKARFRRGRAPHGI